MSLNDRKPKVILEINLEGIYFDSMCFDYILIKVV